MKRIITIIVAIVAACAFSSNADAQILQKRTNVYISYEMLTSDASFRQFDKARKDNQIEILNYLIAQAQKKYVECETIEQLYDVKEHLELIKLYNNSAKQKSISVTNSLRSLENKIIQTEAEYKKEVVIGTDKDTYEYKDDEKE